MGIRDKALDLRLKALRFIFYGLGIRVIGFRVKSLHLPEELPVYALGLVLLWRHESRDFWKVRLKRHAAAITVAPFALDVRPGFDTVAGHLKNVVGVSVNCGGVHYWQTVVGVGTRLHGAGPSRHPGGVGDWDVGFRVE